MKLLIAALWLAAFILLVIAALPINSRVSLALLGAACGVLAYSLPIMQAAGD
jgi:hypothetical protein